MADETVVALIGIIVKDPDSVAQLNETLHEYAQWIIGRMGIPHREKDMNIISVALDAPAGEISDLAGKVGNIPGVTSKTVYPKTE